MKTTLLTLLAGMALLLNACSTPQNTTTTSTTPYSTPTYGSTTSSIVVPAWAPTYADLTGVRYYYLPDCDVYYDAQTQQFMSMSNGAWVGSSVTPTSCSNLDLNNAFVVMLNSNVTTPWLDNSFYQTNYPANSYAPYSNIVTSHAILTDIPSGYMVVPRAFNENSNRVIFIQRPTAGSTTYTYRDVPMSSISAYMPAETHSYYYGGGYPSR
jgi:hypothetical protein